ncbi:MAG: glycogen synthase GlgA [Deltaproteobacteria bacterium]|nr:MAG: glycogen synthase GlgA [Deltaproteobacteria bacterium]
MRVVMLASEAHPLAKTGGLGDVLAALPPALAAAGVDVTVCLPAYRGILRRLDATGTPLRLHAPVASRMEAAAVVAIPEASVPTVAIRADRYFDREALYGPPGGEYPDNAERFAFFCRAALEWLRRLEPPPDVLHLHDWQTSLAAAFLRGTAALYPELATVRTVLTVHNLAYQGRFPFDVWPLLNLDVRYFAPSWLEFYGQVNYLKAGLLFADRITTVSPRYAEEIQTPEFGEGLDGVLRTRSEHLVGILNGVDYAAWNPASDPNLAARYDASDLRGKARCKAALQAELGLPVRADLPLLAIVSRLAEQKGFDLLTATLPELLATTAVQLAILGSGDPTYETALRQIAARSPGRLALRIEFNESLAHRIEAGGDIFLMPSRFEPCGLNQLYSLRYGTVPLVHATGGLEDTVVEFDPAAGTGTGFKFAPYGTEAFVAAVRRALRLHADPAAWQRLMRNGMAQDFSWHRAARSYARLYGQLPPPEVPRLA